MRSPPPASLTRMQYYGTMRQFVSLKKTVMPTEFDIDPYIEQQGEFTYPAGTDTFRPVLSLDCGMAQYLGCAPAKLIVLHTTE